MEVDVERDDESNFFQDSSTMEDSHNQTGFLLQRLRELQAWQHEQELNLLHEQELQLEELKDNANHNVSGTKQKQSDSETEDDDTTIGQDFSSLTSLEEYPQQPSSVQHVDDFDSSSKSSEEAARMESFSLPSWASREDISSKSPVNRNPEDRPVASNLKNFEEILDEKLGIASKTDYARYERKDHDESPTKKSFLRKGSGLARFGGVGGPPKRMTRSKSQVLSRDKTIEKSKFGGSCPRINIAERETISTASKKVTPKTTTKTNYSKTLPPTVRPPSILKLVTSPTVPSPGILRKYNSSDGQPQPATSKPSIGKAPNNDNGIYDSVELSFMEKLAKAETFHKKDLEDLKTFEMLEEAACDSSFCSSSSDVKRLISSVHNMPSPIQKPSVSLESLTSTPLSKKSADPGSTFSGFLKAELHDFLGQKQESFVNCSSSDDENDSTIEEEYFNKNRHSILNGSESDLENGVNKSFDNEDDNKNEEFDQKDVRCRTKNRVRFGDLKGEEQMEFSPPRMSKNSASYLIWSIFGKDRENNKTSGKGVDKKDRNVNRQGNRSAPQLSGDNFSPLSKAPLNYPKTEYEFHTTLLNAKLSELGKEVAHFKSENEKMTQAKRKLQSDRRQLAEEVKSFQASKETERKKLDEERKWVRREKLMFEKSIKDKKSSLDKRTADEIAELQAKVNHLTDDLQRKEVKWAAVVTKLQEQVKTLEKENQNLHNENHKLKLRGVSAKVSTHIVDPYYTAKKITSSEQNNGTPDSGFRSQDNDENEAILKTSRSSNRDQSNLQKTIYNTLCENSDTDSSNGNLKNDESISTPRMTFSSADSLDSNVTLVSASTNSATEKEDSTLKSDKKPNLAVVLKSVSRNEEKGTTEKTYSDGSLEICYSNGNRKEISPGGKAFKVYYYNGDVKETMSNGLVKYFYSQTKTWHLTYPDKKEVLQFSNGQEEIRYPNGNLQISFADGSVKKIFPDGSEDISFPDGTNVTVAKNGDRILRLPNGQREVHTSSMKKREYPDGTLKILYDDGRQETRYTSGRIRIKDREGKLLHDSLSNVM